MMSVKLGAFHDRFYYTSFSIIDFFVSDKKRKMFCFDNLSQTVNFGSNNGCVWQVSPFHSKVEISSTCTIKGAFMVLIKYTQMQTSVSVPLHFHFHDIFDAIIHTRKPGLKNTAKNHDIMHKREPFRTFTSVLNSPYDALHPGSVTGSCSLYRESI